ncbi:MAG: hypothetical protein C0601_08945 [Candidatus Muiribacterium halophilum]|uniref:STAS domain-containing protein n=1 Tax=Muiribacterium halophilum TaxID=2053465 RepID=A0A2N5ZE05_MUIH1|nr:MAG: hypothetical protein C0601_08945 [Candidatus Muirbacterium halophilum]
MDSGGMMLDVQVKKDEKYITFTLEGSLKESELSALKLESEKIEFDRDVKFDLARLDYVDSSGLGLFSQLYKKCKVKNVKMILKDANDSFKKLLEISNLTDLFTFEGEEKSKDCSECRFYEPIDYNFGRCKCTNSSGYDLIVEKNSSCESFE